MQRVSVLYQWALAALLMSVNVSACAAERYGNEASTGPREILKVGILSRVADKLGSRDYYFETELPYRVFREVGFEARISNYNYPRLVRSLNQGLLDVGPIFRFGGKFLTPEKPDFSCADRAHLGLPLIISKLVNNDEIPNVLSASDLDKYSIGYFRSLEKDIDPFINRPNFKPANNVSSLFKMLKGARIDMVLADFVITQSLSRELKIETKEVFKAGVLEVFMCASHKQREPEMAKKLANSYGEALRELQESGELKAFLLAKGLTLYEDLFLPEPQKILLQTDS